jgi:hypothetical protein
MTPIAKNEQAWLERFFSGSNALRWEQIACATGPEDWIASVTPWLEFLRQSPLDRPLLLPLFASNGTRRWYAMAANDQIASQLMDELRGFIGPSFSDFSGQWHELSNSDAPECALRSRFGWRVLRINLSSESNRLHVEQCISRYRELLTRRPFVPDRTSRPFGTIRRAFDLALLAGNADRARQLKEEMISTGRIGTDQQRFLQIRFLAGLGRVEEIGRDRVLLDSIMNLSLPPQIIVDVVESLYAIYVEPVERSLEISALAALFHQHIARPFGPLFRERKGVRRPRVLRAFFLFEVGEQLHNSVRCEALVEAYPKEDESFSLVQRWLQTLTPRIRTNVASEVRQAIADEDYEAAMNLAIEELPARWAYSALLRCGVEAESDAVRSRVLTHVQRIDAGVLSEFTERDRGRWARLINVTSVSPTSHAESGWVEWANEVITRIDDWAPLEVLSNAVLKWDVSTYGAHPQSCTKLAEMIGNASEPNAQIFRDAFPILVDFFVDRPVGSTRAFASIYSMLIKVIAWSGTVSGDELEICSSLTRALLSSGSDEELYTECLQDLQEIIKANAAPIHLDWALGIAELLAQFPPVNRELRLRVFFTIFEMARATAHRLSAEQRTVLELLAADYEVPELITGLPSTARSENEKRAHFSGVIGVYTLNEPAGRRAREVIERLLPEAKVELNHSTTANDRLRYLAKNADLFVFAWKTSTHQAFYCVQDARKDGDIILPPGGGTASLVKSVMEAALTFAPTIR